MNHDNRNQVRVPRRLWDELMLALDQSLLRIEALDPDASIVTKQVYEFGQRVLTEARRRDARGANRLRSQLPRSHGRGGGWQDLGH